MGNKGFSALILIFVVLIIIVVGVFGHFASKKNTNQNAQSSDIKTTSLSKTKSNPFNESYSQGKCQGEGTLTFTHSPMKIEDIREIKPYGIMTDGHVLPTSHGYFYPAEFNSARDKYPVYAIADGVIVRISHRGAFIGDNSRDRITDEYQMYFEHSCSLYSYYDLLTSLSPELEKAVGKMTGFEHKAVRIPVKAGQLVGRIGGQTVDFAVWNFEKEPAFFVNPKSYQGDEDRFYLEDMFLHFAEPLRSQLLAKNIRTAEPRSGKVAYDIDGKLVGNWFREGSGGFSGNPEIKKQPGFRYWDGHLSVSYDFIDATQIKFSIGNFEGKADQFSIKGNSPDPATIDVEAGLIKYELISTVSSNSPPGKFEGTVLLQLIEPSKLKLELFPDKNADHISGFTSKAELYQR